MEQHILDLFNKAGLDLDKLFKEEKLRKDLFDYYGVAEIDATYMTFYQKKSGNWRRKLWTIILTEDSQMSHRRMNIKWDEKKELTFRVFMDMRSVVQDEYGRYGECSISFHYSVDLVLENVRTHCDHGSYSLREE